MITNREGVVKSFLADLTKGSFPYALTNGGKTQPASSRTMGMLPLLTEFPTNSVQVRLLQGSSLSSPWEGEEELQLTYKPHPGPGPVAQPTDRPWGHSSRSETCANGVTWWEVINPQPLRHGHQILWRPLIIQDFLCYPPKIPSARWGQTRRKQLQGKKGETPPHLGVDIRSLDLNANQPLACPAQYNLFKMWQEQLRNRTL